MEYSVEGKMGKKNILNLFNKIKTQDLDLPTLDIIKLNHYKKLGKLQSSIHIFYYE